LIIAGGENMRIKTLDLRVKVVVCGFLAAGVTSACGRPRKDALPTPPASQSAPTPEAPPADEELIITSLPSLPGRSIVATKGGLYCRFFEYSGTGDYGDRFRKALDGITSEGKQKGANAFVQASVSSESHEIQGSKWHSSIVHICGDFVRLN
jgi:hypothetical protein